MVNFTANSKFESNLRAYNFREGKKQYIGSKELSSKQIHLASSTIDRIYLCLLIRQEVRKRRVSYGFAISI